MINDIIRKTLRGFGRGRIITRHPKTMEAVENDLLLAEEYSITSVLTLIINGKHRVSGALPLQRISSSIQKVVGEGL